MNGAVSSLNMLEGVELFLPLASLDQEQYAQLLDELRMHPGSPATKQNLLEMICTLTPADAPGKILEKIVPLRCDAFAYSPILGQWAAKEPEAALAWYQKSMASNALRGRGVDSNPEASLLVSLIAGLAETDTRKSVDLFLENATRSDVHVLGAADGIATNIGREIKEGGDDRQLRRLLEWSKEHDHDADFARTDSIVWSAMRGAVAEAAIETVARFAAQYLEEERERRTALIQHMANHVDAPFGERAKALLEYLPEQHRAAALESMILRSAAQEGRA